MNLELGAWVIGWREAVIGLIALVVLYMAAVLWRMRRLDRPPLPTPAPFLEPVMPPDAFPGEQKTWQEASAHLATETFMQGVEAELSQLREETDALRGEVAALREELRRASEQMRNAQAVSPLYHDAMQMAAAGRDAATIAERCGIARAEADLVVALVQRPAPAAHPLAPHPLATASFSQSRSQAR